MPFRTVSIGHVQVAIGVQEALARRIRRSRPAKALYIRRREPAQSAPDAATNALRTRVGGIDWYHTIDLGHGVATPGLFDHRGSMQHYPIPERLDGLRVLDVATFDGYWAFEFERRGAKEVVAIDIDTVADLDLAPDVRKRMSETELNSKVGRGFGIASEALASKVKRAVCSVYDLSPEKLGKFDLVFCGSLLLHLRDPLRALERIRSMIGGVGIFVEAFNPGLPMQCAEYKGGRERCVWWAFSKDCLHRMFTEAGFGSVELLDVFSIISITDQRPIWHAAYRVTP